MGMPKAMSLMQRKQSMVSKLPAGFVPGHPIAGAELTGVHAGKVDFIC